jgi:hypothetical protein
MATVKVKWGTDPLSNCLNWDPFTIKFPVFILEIVHSLSYSKKEVQKKQSMGGYFRVVIEVV